MEVVAGYDQQVADWAGAVCGVKFIPPFWALGIVDSGVLKGAAVFNDFHGANANVEMSYVGPLTKGIVRYLANYAFNTLNVSRVSFKTRKSNLKAKRLLSGHGFEYEGTKRRYLDTTSAGDVLTYVLFRENAKRWLS